MKYNLDFSEFSKMILESILGEEDLNERHICIGCSKWIDINDNNIEDCAFNIRIIMKYLLAKFPNIISFKLPEVSDNEKKSYELYVVVNTSDRRNLYVEILNELKRFQNIKEQVSDIELNNKETDYQIGLADIGSAGKFENPESIKLFPNELNKPQIQDTNMSIGLFTKSKVKPELNTLVQFRLEEEKTKGNLIKASIGVASTLLDGVFKNADKTISATGENGKMSPENFSKNLLDVIKKKNVSSIEFLTYESLFDLNKMKQDGTVNGVEFIPAKLPNDVKNFINQSTSLKVIAELLIPWLLVNHIYNFNGINLMSKLGNTIENDKVTSVFWPKSATNENTDYGVSFLKFKSGKEIGISAKGDGEGGHKVSAFSVIAKNPDAFKDAKNTIVKVCADTITQVKNNGTVNQTNVFYCICAASAIMNNGKIDETAITELNKMFKVLTSSENRLSKKTFNELYENTLQKYLKLVYNTKNNELKLTDKSINLGNYKTAWPYSLTNVCERIVVNALNNDDNGKSKSEFYKIKMGGNAAYHQIELGKSGSDTTVFTITHIPPKPIEQNKDYSSFIVFIVVSGSGDNSITMSSSIKDCIHIAKGGGSHGAVVGYKLLKTASS